MSSQKPYPYPTADDATHDGPGERDARSGMAPQDQPVGRPAMGRAYLSEDERAASILAHLSAPAAAILSVGWLSFLGPLLVWFVYKDRSAAVRRAAAGAFNFNVSFSVLYVIGWILLFTIIGAPVAVLLWLVIFVVAAVCHIKGAMRSARGEEYTYPFQIRILS